MLTFSDNDKGVIDIITIITKDRIFLTFKEACHILFMNFYWKKEKAKRTTTFAWKTNCNYCSRVKERQFDEVMI